jgi:aminopeptidase N
MKISTAKLLSLSIFLLTIASCSLFGINLKVKNPNKSGKDIKFTTEQILLGELTELRTCFDVTYYDLEVEIFPNSKFIKGTVQIHAKTVSDFDSIQFDLHPNFDISSLTDFKTGESLSFSRLERAVFVKFKNKKDEGFIIEIEYEGKPIVAKKAPWEGGFVWKKDYNKNDWIGVACEGEGANVWWPLKDHTSDEPDSTRLHYTCPKGLMAIGNGQFESEVQNNNTTTFNWFVSYPINTYNISVYVGDFIKVSDTYTGITNKTLSLDYYVLKRNKELAKKHFKQCKPILALYEKRFGEYPWYRDGFKLIESPYSGMEHQTAIAYGNGYKNGKYSGSDYIIVHEIAHEWWGNSITAKDFSDVWIQEGFATYSEALYAEEVNGKKGYDQSLFFSRLMIKNKYPVVGDEDRRWFHYRICSDVYGKGAWILHTLRTQLNNDRLFFDIIKSFYEENKYSIVESKDFISHVNYITSNDYTWFFNQYLNNNFAPELEYAISDRGLLHYRWKNTNPNFDKLKLKVYCQSGDFSIIPSNVIKTIRMPNSNPANWNISFGEDNFVAISKNNKILKE